MANLKKSLKRGIAALLAVCLVLSSFNGVAWAAETPDEDVPYEDIPAKFVLKYDAAEFIESAQEAIQSGEIFSAEEMEFAKSDYNKLFNDSDSTVFEFYPEEREEDEFDKATSSDAEEEAATLDDFFGADVRMFIRVNDWDSESEEEYVMTGEEEIIFLFINAMEEKLTFQIDINGYITKEITVPGNTSSLGGFGSASGSNADKKVPDNKINTSTPGKNDGAAALPVPEPTPAEQPTTEQSQPASTEESSEAVTEPTETLPAESSEAAESVESTEEPSEALENSTAVNEEATTEAAGTEEETTEAVETQEVTAEANTTEANTAEAEETSAEAVVETEAQTEKETEAPVETEETEAVTEEQTEETDPVISMSLNQVPMVGSAPQDLEEEEDFAEEEAVTETVMGNLPGKTLGVSQIVEEDATAKVMVTKSSVIMNLSSVDIVTLNITHKLVTNEHPKMQPHLPLIYYEKISEKISFGDNDIFDCRENGFTKSIFGLNLKSEGIVRKSDIKNGSISITFEYELNDGYYVEPWIADKYIVEHNYKIPADKQDYFPRIVDHDGRYPIYTSADQAGPYFPNPHSPEYAQYNADGVKICTTKGNGWPDPSTHYVILDLSGAHGYPSDALTYIRCDKYRGEEEGKYYWEVGFVSGETGADIDRITVEQKKDGNSIKNTHSDYELPTVDKEGNYIVGWYAEDDLTEQPLSSEYIKTLMINGNRNFIAIIGEEPEGNGTLTIAKRVVEGVELVGNLRFAFQLTLDDGKYTNSIMTADGQIFTSKNGIYNFELSSSEAITFVELPVGLKYTVSENSDAGNEYVSSSLKNIIVESSNAATEGNSVTGTIIKVSEAGEGIWRQQDFEYNDNSVVIGREKMLTDAEKIRELVERAGDALGENYTHTEYYPVGGGDPVDKEPAQIAKTETYTVSWVSVSYDNKGTIELQAKGNNINSWKKEDFSSANDVIGFLMARYEFDSSVDNLQSLLEGKKNISLYVDPNVKPSGKEGRLYLINNQTAGENLYQYISSYYESLGFKSEEKTGQDNSGNNFMYTVTAVPGYSRKVTYTFNPTTVSTGSNDYIQFNNVLSMHTVKLQIQKSIDKMISENPTFIFKVENTDKKSLGYGQVFFVQITMSDGEMEKSHSIDNLPVGIYEITEYKHMRYRCVDVSIEPSEAGTSESAVGKAIVQAYGEECTVSFINKLSGAGYFTNTDIIVNKVIKDKNGSYLFKPHNADGTQRRLPITEAKTLDLAILPGKQKSFDDPENFGDNIPFGRC